MKSARPAPLILCIAAIAFAFAACGDSSESNGTSAAPPTTVPATSESLAEEGGAAQSTSPPELSALSGDLIFAGQSLSLDSGCVNTFDPSGTGRITLQFIASDATTLEIVAFPEEDPGVSISQDGRVWSTQLATAPFTLEVDTEAGSAAGSGSLVEGRTTANPEPDETPAALDFSVTWDTANPCP